MTRFYELLEKRKSLKANIFEEEELIELSKSLPEGELNKINPELLTYSNSKRLDNIMSLLNELDTKIVNNKNK